MKRISLVGAALVAAIALAAIGSASALAAPTLLLKGGGAFPQAFTTSSQTSLVLTSAAGTKVTCTAATTSGGEAESETAAKATIKFTGCSSTGGNACKTAGASAKEIDIPIVGKLDELSSKVYLLLEINPSPQTFKCGTVEVETKGSVCAELLTALNTSTKTLVFTLLGSGSNDSSDPLEAKFGSSGSYESATMTGEFTETFTELVEVS
jgi:hypothetical protein